LKISSTSILISILITGIKSAITKTVVDVALWVLGTILSIVMGLFLFSSQARFDKNTLRFVYDVKFTVLERFVVAVFLIIISLIIISVKMPPIIAIINHGTRTHCINHKHHRLRNTGLRSTRLHATSKKQPRRELKPVELGLRG